MYIGNNNNIIQNFLINIKSKYILKQIVDNIEEEKLLAIIQHNKTLQDKLDITINDYEYYKKIEVEIIPIIKSYKNIFIEIPNRYASFYHIYFNEENNEIKRNYFTKNEKIKKIKIKIEKEVK